MFTIDDETKDKLKEAFRHIVNPGTRAGMLRVVFNWQHQLNDMQLIMTIPGASREGDNEASKAILALLKIPVGDEWGIIDYEIHMYYAKVYFGMEDIPWKSESPERHEKWFAEKPPFPYGYITPERWAEIYPPWQHWDLLGV